MLPMRYVHPSHTRYSTNPTQFGPLCHVGPSTTADSTHQEDCLFLNVFAPTANTGLHPVFVFFQGGGFNQLSNANLDGNSLINAADHDMVVVSFNYRVSAYGFLASKEVKANGDLNAGLLDQRKVLQWVRKYIQLFGGDPKHVTIGGDSAGGASVDLHLSAYGGRDDGLFHAAAAESQSFGAQLTVEESQYQYDALVQRVGCDTAAGPVGDTLKCLREVDVSVIAENNINIPTPGGGGGDPLYMYSNVIDGTFTPDYTYNLFAQGKFVKVPVIFGYVISFSLCLCSHQDSDDTNEGTIFTPSAINNYTDMNTFLRNNFAKLNASQLAQIDSFYPKAEQFPSMGTYWRTAANAYGEMRYICPGIYLSSVFPKYGVLDSWNYQ
jgi:carboxylesterase type B